MNLEGKIVFSAKTHRAFTEIAFTDGTRLVVYASNIGDLHTEITKGKPHKKKRIPWKENEKKFFATLGLDDKDYYKKVKYAFFWLVENKEKVRSYYSFFDKHLNQQRSSFAMQLDTEVDDPKGILTIFFSSNVAPECDDWFVLGKKKDWKRILKMYEEVANGKKSDRKKKDGN